MKSSVAKRSVVIAGRRTSVSLEYEFWKSLKEIGRARHESVTQLINTIDADRKNANLSSAIRLFVLGFYRDQPVSRDQIAVGSTLEGRAGDGGACEGRGSSLRQPKADAQRRP